MTNLTTRSKITVRWTTNPADMGYEGRPSDWLTLPGKTLGIRAALDFEHSLSQKIGHGTYRRVRYTHNGTVVTRDQMQAVITDAEYRKMAI